MFRVTRGKLMLVAALVVAFFAVAAPANPNTAHGLTINQPIRGAACGAVSQGGAGDGGLCGGDTTTTTSTTDPTGPEETTTVPVMDPGKKAPLPGVVTATTLLQHPAGPYVVTPPTTVIGQAASTAIPPQLPKTGGSTEPLISAAIALLILGIGAIVIKRHPQERRW